MDGKISGEACRDRIHGRHGLLQKQNGPSYIYCLRLAGLQETVPAEFLPYSSRFELKSLLRMDVCYVPSKGRSEELFSTLSRLIVYMSETKVRLRMAIIYSIHFIQMFFLLSPHPAHFEFRALTLQFVLSSHLPLCEILTTNGPRHHNQRASRLLSLCNIFYRI